MDNPARLLALLLAAALVAAAAALFRARDLRAGHAGSSFHGDPSGSRGLRKFLQAEGWMTEPLTRTVTPGLPGAALIVLEANLETDAEAARIAAWVQGGGLLLLAGGSAPELGRKLGITLEASTGESPGVAHAAAGTVGPATLATGTGGAVRGGTVLYSRAGTPQVATAELGRGRAVVFADSFPFSNRGVDAGDNIVFLLDLLSRWSSKSRGPVWFLETHHGYERGLSLLEYFRSAGHGPLLAALAALGLLAMWTFGARRAPVLGPPLNDRKPAVEYAATLAHLYRRTGARRHALDVARRELERVVATPAFRRAAARPGAAIEDSAKRLIDDAVRLGSLPGASEEAVRRWAAAAAEFRRTLSHDDAR